VEDEEPDRARFRIRRDTSDEIVVTLTQSDGGLAVQMRERTLGAYSPAFDIARRRVGRAVTPPNDSQPSASAPVADAGDVP
jgi:hypothetical protein